MARMCGLFFVIAAYGVPSVALAVQLAEHPALTATKTLSKKPGCGPVAMMSAKRAHTKAKLPGAGMQPVAPFVNSYMDGYYMVGCVKDDMFLHGDKFGDGKYSYNVERIYYLDSSQVGPVSNVSIVHYGEVIPKEDTEAMTHEVCFAFCRTIKDMSFFGLTHGRDCYCTPYYNQIAGDSSDCDAVCEGDPTNMCGGMSKSTIFEMHSCNDATANLDAASAAAQTQRLTLVGALTEVAASAQSMQAGAATLQKSFGKVGDSAATTLMQAAKVFAGKLQHASEDGYKLATKIEDLESSAASVAGADASLESLTAELKEATASAKEASADLKSLASESTAPKIGLNTSAELYYPAMYFADKKFVDVPSTCAGELAASPLIASYDGCAAACEAAVGTCVGFSYFGEASLCFLLSSLETVTYYTGCAGGAFLELRARVAQPEGVKCVVKYAKFDGKSIKPDPKGKCTTCLDKLAKADRCFE